MLRMIDYYGDAQLGRAWYRLNFVNRPPRTSRLRQDFRDLVCTTCNLPLHVRWAADPRRCLDCLRRRPGQTYPPLPRGHCSCPCQCSDDGDDPNDADFIPDPRDRADAPFDNHPHLLTNLLQARAGNTVGSVLARATNVGPVPQSRLYRAETHDHHNAALTSQYNQQDLNDFVARQNYAHMQLEANALQAPISTWEVSDLQALGWSMVYIRQQFPELPFFHPDRSNMRPRYMAPPQCTVCNRPRSDRLRGWIDNQQVPMCGFCRRPRRPRLPPHHFPTLQELQECACRCTCQEDGVFITADSDSDSGSDSGTPGPSTNDQTVTIQPSQAAYGSDSTVSTVILDGPSDFPAGTPAFLNYHCNRPDWQPATWVNSLLQRMGFCARSHIYELANHIRHSGLFQPGRARPSYNELVAVMGNFARHTAMVMNTVRGVPDPLYLAQAMVMDEDPLSPMFANGIRRSIHTASGLPIQLEHAILQADPAAFGEGDMYNSLSPSTEDGEDIRHFLNQLPPAMNHDGHANAGSGPPSPLNFQIVFAQPRLSLTATPTVAQTTGLDWTTTPMDFNNDNHGGSP